MHTRSHPLATDERKAELLASIKTTMRDVQRHYEPSRRILLENVPAHGVDLSTPDGRFFNVCQCTHIAIVSNAEPARAIRGSVPISAVSWCRPAVAAKCIYAVGSGARVPAPEVRSRVLPSVRAMLTAVCLPAGAFHRSGLVPPTHVRDSTRRGAVRNVLN